MRITRLLLIGIFCWTSTVIARAPHEDPLSYGSGVMVGINIERIAWTLDGPAFMAGLEDGLFNGKLRVPTHVLQQAVAELAEVRRKRPKAFLWSPHGPASIAPHSPEVRMGYAAGVQFGYEYAAVLRHLDVAMFKQGIIDMVSKSERFTKREFKNFAESGAAAFAEIAALENQSKQQSFLEWNAQRPGVQTTASGLQYEIVVEGAGPVAADAKWVSLHFTARVAHGRKLSSSYDKGEPVRWRVGDLIRGLQELIRLSRVGSHVRAWIPSDLAHGVAGMPRIGPNEALEVELLLVKL